MEKINSIKLDFDGNVSGNIKFIMDKDSARVLEVEIDENFTDYKADLLIEQSDIMYKIKSFSEDSKLRFNIPVLKSGLAKFQIRIYKNDKVLHSNYFKTVVKNTLDSDFWSIESENIETSNIDLSKYILKEELESLDIFVKKDEIIDYSVEIEEIMYKLKELSEKKADITLEDLSSILSDYVKAEEIKDYSKEIKDLQTAINSLNMKDITDEEINELISNYLLNNGIKNYSNDIDELKNKINDFNYENEIEVISSRLNDIENNVNITDEEIKELNNNKVNIENYKNDFDDLNEKIKNLELKEIDEEALTNRINAYLLDNPINNGLDGKDGKDGADGNGIEKIELVNSVGLDDNYKITLTNGETFDFTIKNGKDGMQGETGLSAYEIWIENGNSGTKEEFLKSLKGIKGENATVDYELISENIKKQFDTGEIQGIPFIVYKSNATQLAGGQGLRIKCEPLQKLNTAIWGNEMTVLSVSIGIGAQSSSLNNSVLSITPTEAYIYVANSWSGAQTVSITVVAVPTVSLPRLTAISGQAEDYADLKAEVKELKNTIRTLNQGGISKYSEFDSDRIALVNANGTVNTPRVQVHTGEGNNRIFRIYYNKTFSKTPVIIATLNTKNDYTTTGIANFNGGNEEYFLVKVNYITYLADISYQAYVIGD